MNILSSLILVAFLIGFRPAHAQHVQLIDLSEIKDKFENSLSIIKERLEAVDPPRYHLKKAEISFAVSSGLDGNLKGKIPVAIGSVAFEGDYGQVRTTRETYTYVPRSSIPVNFDDLGVAAFLAGLQEKVGANLRSADFLVTAARHEEEFVIVLSGEGKLEFLSLVSFGAAAETSNSHKMTFHFCLLGNDGSCVE